MIEYADNFPDSEYDPYALAIGKFALNWNFLQHTLCELFSIVTLQKAPQPGDRVHNVPFDVWHSLKSDRAQREILEAAIKSSPLGEKNDLAQSGKWLCVEVNKLETRRNEIMHSALILMRYGTEKREVVPMHFSRSPLTRKLSEVENLLVEFQSVSHNAAVLSDYATGLNHALLTTRAPWPKKPSLQGRPRTKKPVTSPPTRRK